MFDQQLPGRRTSRPTAPPHPDAPRAPARVRLADAQKLLRDPRSAAGCSSARPTPDAGSRPAGRRVRRPPRAREMSTPPRDTSPSRLSCRYTCSRPLRSPSCSSGAHRAFERADHPCAAGRVHRMRPPRQRPRFVALDLTDHVPADSSQRPAPAPSDTSAIFADASCSRDSPNDEQPNSNRISHIGCREEFRDRQQFNFFDIAPRRLGGRRKPVANRGQSVGQFGSPAGPRMNCLPAPPSFHPHQ